MNIEIPNAPIQRVDLSILKDSSIEVNMLRVDLNDKNIQGNKLYKLKYNLLRAKDLGKRTLLTFGGAFSNHIAATAAAGKAYGFNTIGIIRGEELAKKPLNPTLETAQENGMKLSFISRSQYKEKYDTVFIQELKEKFGDVYVLPEGGTNDLAVKGCEEILHTKTNIFDTICVSIGTGGTFSGIVNSSQLTQKVIGFPVMKQSTNEKARIAEFTKQTNYEIINADIPIAFGKLNDELISFVQNFYKETNLILDPLYTCRMMYTLVDMIRNGKFKENTKILAVHTGGLQSWKGINQKLLSQGKQPII